MRTSIETVSNIWELGHMRCIVSDLLAKCDEDGNVRARMESYQHWDALHKLMLDVKDAKVNSIRHKRRRGEGEEAVQRLALGEELRIGLVRLIEPA